MEAEIYVRGKARARTLIKPRAGGSVWPDQRCPAFTPRAEGLACMQGCWYCRYGNFHLHERVALEVGICCWPKVQID